MGELRRQTASPSKSIFTVCERVGGRNEPLGGAGGCFFGAVVKDGYVIVTGI